MPTLQTDPSPRRRQLGAVELARRTRELDNLRLSRPLTPAERAEADNLSARAAMRAWRQAQRDAERRLAQGVRA